MVIIEDGNTYRIEWSDCNNGWMYYIYIDVEMTESELNDTETQEDDGGLCTGTLFDAIEMAGISNIK
jgi:hypothetical protein